MGETEAGPFNGHASPVKFVAFLPDGQHIILGSDNQTICMWNATMGETEADPYTGHTDLVCSMAFSSDGQHIILGSDN